MSKWGFIVGLFTLVFSTGSGWAQSCPSAPSGSKPGWTVLFYNTQAKTGGLMPDAAYSSMRVRKFPIRFADLPDVARAGDIPKLVFKGNFMVCEPGHYEFALIIEGGPNQRPRSLLCRGFVQSGTTKLIEIDKPGFTTMIGAGLQRAFTGTMELEPGAAEMALSLTCATQSFGGRTTVMRHSADEMLLGSVVTLRVRGPKDNAPREFRDGEIVSPGS